MEFLVRILGDVLKPTFLNKECLLNGTSQVRDVLLECASVGRWYRSYGSTVPVIIISVGTWTWPGTRIPRRWTCRCSPARGRAGHAHVYLSTKKLGQPETTVIAYRQNTEAAELAIDPEHLLYRERDYWDQKRGDKSIQIWGLGNEKTGGIVRKFLSLGTLKSLRLETVNYLLTFLFVREIRL